MEASGALQDRQFRAVEVAQTYLIEYAGCQTWVVQHPIEPERCYLVDMIAEHCTCPDYNCTANPMGIFCKHLLAIDPIWREMTGKERACFVQNGRPTTDSGVIAVITPDPDDPFKD